MSKLTFHETLPPCLYYSGVYGQKETTVDTNGNLIGGTILERLTPRTALCKKRRQATPGFFGSMRIWARCRSGLQYGHLWLQPWNNAGGPGQANTNMVFSQLRYNLP